MSTAVTSDYLVRLYDGEDANGLAQILTTLLMQNFESFPARHKTARRIPRPVAVHSTDTVSTATIVFGHDEAVVYNDIVGRPSVIVKATVDQILNTSQLEMRAGGLMPVGFFTPRGLGILRAILTRKMGVKGLLTHTITALHFIALVSVVS